MNIKKLISVIVLFFLAGCERILFDDEPNTPENNFRIFWDDFDKYYSQFQIRNIDWDSIYNAYSPLINSSTNDIELYNYLSEIIGFINDVHVNLYTPFGVARCRSCNIAYTSMYLLNGKKYIVFNQSQENANIIKFGDIIGENIGYIKIITFSGSSDDDRFLMIDDIISEFYNKTGIIIDIRANGGGNSSNANKIASRFADEKRLYERFYNKTGRDANDFSGWIESYIEPEGKKQFLKPVVVLTSRRTFSSSEDFVLSMKVFPHVTQVGDTTGGGIGNPVFRELPNGWVYRLSTKVTAAPDGLIVEGNGIPPDFTILNSETDSITGVDRMLEKGVEIIESFNEQSNYEDEFILRKR